VFVNEHKADLLNGIPCGFRAVWDNRHELTVAKLADNLAVEHVLSNWQALLVESDGADRSKDDFIEAYIYKGFDVQAVEAMQIDRSARLSRTQKIDSKLALTAFKKLRSRAENTT